MNVRLADLDFEKVEFLFLAKQRRERLCHYRIEHKSGRVNVNLNYCAVLEFFCLAQDVLNDYIATVVFRVNYVFKLSFSIENNVEFTH